MRIAKPRIYKLKPLHEYQTYALKDLEVDGLSKTELKNALSHMSHKTKLFDLDGSTLKTSHNVGIAASNGIYIQVLPKLLMYNEGRNSNLLSNLLYMLSVCKDTFNYLGESSAEIDSSQDLMELLIFNYASILLKLVAREPLLRYIDQEVITDRPRGKINLDRTLKIQLENKAKTACYINELSHDNLELQFFKYVCAKSLTITSSRKTKSILRSVLSLMRNVSDKIFGGHEASRITLSRQFVRYEKPLSLGLMILRSLNPIFKGRDIKPLSIEFDMNNLFERYLNYLCIKYKDRLNAKNVISQKPVTLIDSLLNLDLDTRQKYKRIGKIDTFLSMNQGKDIVLDAKYKVLQNSSKPDFSLHDLYQINTYQSLAASSSRKVASALVYPKNHDDKCLQLENQDYQVKWFIKTIDLHRNLRSDELDIVDEISAFLGVMAS